MTASATEPQTDAPPEPQQAITEPLPPLELLPPPAPEPQPWWQERRSALLLIGVPIAGALLVWIALSVFGSNSPKPPEAEIAQGEPAADTTLADEAAAAAETPLAPEAIPGTFPNTEPAAVTEAEPAPEVAPATEVVPATEAVAQVPAEPEPVPVTAPAPVEQSDASVAAASEVLPKPPQSALNTINGTVRVSVRVTVDKEGKVIDATPENGGPSRYFERLSLEASRKWTFAPQPSDEQRTVLLKFNFTREGVTAKANAAG